MSGRGRGFCLVSVPDEPGAARTGFAGQGGRRFQAPGDPRAAETFALRSRLRELQDGLDEIRRRLAALDAGGPAGTGSRA